MYTYCIALYRDKFDAIVIGLMDKLNDTVKLAINSLVRRGSITLFPGTPLYFSAAIKTSAVTLETIALG